MPKGAGRIGKKKEHGQRFFGRYEREKRVYPEMANLILQKEGIFDAVNKVIIPKSIESMTISAETDVRPFRYDAVNELLKDCDE